MCLRDRGTEGLCHVWEASPGPRTTCDVWCCRAPPFCCEVRVRACPMPFPRGLAGVAPPCSGTGTRSDRRSPDFPGACGRGGEGDGVALGMGMGPCGGAPRPRGAPADDVGGASQGLDSAAPQCPGGRLGYCEVGGPSFGTEATQDNERGPAGGVVDVWHPPSQGPKGSVSGGIQSIKPPIPSPWALRCIGAAPSLSGA